MDIKFEVCNIVYSVRNIQLQVSSLENKLSILIAKEKHIKTGWTTIIIVELPYINSIRIIIVDLSLY